VATQKVEAAASLVRLQFLSQFPEFQGITDMNHLASVANQIATQNPQRWQAIQQSAARVETLNGALAQERAQAQQREQQETFQRARTVSDEFERQHNIGRDLARAMADYARDEMGFNPQDPTMQRLLTMPKFYEAVLKSYKYDALMKNPPQPARKPALPVAKPSTRVSTNPRDNYTGRFESRQKLPDTLSIDQALGALASRRSR
jgi:hypothetical protein